jgi:hypothetical protein
MLYVFVKVNYSLDVIKKKKKKKESAKRIKIVGRDFCFLKNPGCGLSWIGY